MYYCVKFGDAMEVDPCSVGRGGEPRPRDVLIPYNPTDRHGRTFHLSKAEVHDLVVFLRSVEGARAGSRVWNGWSEE